jgi:hypothetical protein
MPPCTQARVIVTADVPHVPETRATLPDVYSFEVWSATTFVEDTPVDDAVSVNCESTMMRPFMCTIPTSRSRGDA